MECDLEELEATKNREKTADEIFADLGYKKVEDNFTIRYIEDIELMEETIHTEIKFIKALKAVGSEELLGRFHLQAINKKVEELRMDEENIIKIDKNLILERQAKCKEDIKYYERKYRYAKENNDTFYMKSHWRTINRLQAEFETLGWILSYEIKD